MYFLHLLAFVLTVYSAPDCTPDSWDATLSGDSLMFDGATVSTSSTNHDWHTAYGNTMVSSGVHTWTLEVVAWDNAASNFWEGIIGVAHTYDHADTYMSSGHDGYGYIAENGQKTNAGSQKDYGAPWGTVGSIITVTLDLDNLQVSFALNGVDQGVSHTAITPGTYRLAVSLGDKTDSLKLGCFGTKTTTSAAAPTTSMAPPTTSMAPTTEAATTEAPTTTSTGSLCSVFQCGEDAMHKPLANTIDGNSFSACCECTYVASNHVFLGTFMEGDFDKESRKLSLSFDLPGDVTLESIVWNGAQDESLSFANGLWKSSNLNTCRVRYEINEGLAQLFGAGSHFSLSGTTLTSSIQIEASTNIHERGQSFDRTYSESVPILVGLETTATVDATFHMKHQDIPEKVDITGNAENFATDGSVVLTMMVTSPGCIRHSGSITTGMEHITEPEFTFGEKHLVNNLCKQEVTLKFNPVKAFTDTLEVQFITRQGNQFSIQIDVNIQAGSILDYLPFDASMTFHADGAFNDEPQTEFLLGAEVYTSIVVSPLINLPLSHIEINTFTLTQTGYSNERETTDLMGADWAKFKFNALPENKEITAEFELESTHFHVSKHGELCDIKADITIQYQDGVTIRRQLTARRRLSTQNAANSFRIVDHLSTESMVSSMLKPEHYKIGMVSLGLTSLALLYCTISSYAQRKKDELYHLIGDEI